MDRISLHNMLLKITPNVYFQPPETYKMSYPCILYDRTEIVPTKANNGNYQLTTKYDLTVIDANPDSSIVYDVAQLPFCKHTSFYVSDQLNHDTFTIYI